MVGERYQEDSVFDDDSDHERKGANGMVRERFQQGSYFGGDSVHGGSDEARDGISETDWLVSIIYDILALSEVDAGKLRDRIRSRFDKGVSRHIDDIVSTLEKRSGGN